MTGTRVPRRPGQGPPAAAAVTSGTRRPPGKNHFYPERAGFVPVRPYHR